MLLEIAEPGTRTRENVVLRDATGTIAAWGSVHDRSVGRMLLVLLLDRDLARRRRARRRCRRAGLGRGPSRAVARARGSPCSSIDTGAFAGDEAHAALLAAGGFDRSAPGGR